MASELKPYGYAPGSYMNNCKSCGQSFMGDKRAWNCEPCAKALSLQADTLPAPAATDTGLETVGEVSTVRERVAAFAGHMSSGQLKPGDLLCLRSQAEELLAAERAEKEELRRAIMGEEPDPDLQHGNFLEMAATLHRACDGARKRAEYAEQRLGQSEAELKQARADNAAKETRIKELEEEVEWAQNAVLARQRHAEARCETLEVKLAAAEKAARSVEEWWLSEGMKHFDGAPYCIFATRAVLGGKPSC